MAQSVPKRSLLRRLGRAALWLIGAVLLLVLLTGWLTRPAPPDLFYAPPAGPPARPGVLIRSEPFDRALPDGARAWRILYTTTRIDNRPAVASALVVVPARPSPAPLPVVAWAHGTTGIAPGCAPSVLADPFQNVPGVEGLLREGWAFVATDYPGLGTEGGHAYLVGDDAARAVLDAVRAARALPGLTLANRVVVWGHSQGGGSALWTGIRAPSYAPDVSLIGVAAMAPASDLPGLVTANRTTVPGRIISAYILRAYAAAYPDVDEDTYLGSVTAPLVRDIAARCMAGTKALFMVGEALLLPNGIFAADPASGALGRRLRENIPTAPIAAPLLIAQGNDDPLVRPELQDGYVAARCAAGQAVDYRHYPGRDHLSLVAPDSPLIADLIAWTRDRFAGRPPSPNCPVSGGAAPR